MKSSAVMVGVSVALSLRAAMAGQDLPQHLKDLAVVWLDANTQTWKSFRPHIYCGIDTRHRGVS